MEIRAKNHDFSLGYGQYKSLLGQLYPQSSLLRSQILMHLQVGIQSLFLQLY